MDAAPDSTEEPRAAAIVDDRTADVDALLASITRDLQGRGLRVRGLLMTRETAHGCAGDMVLVDIASGDRYLVSQPLGSGSTACRADPQGFARASRVLRDALREQPDLVVCNRFGALEAEGGGFAAELLALMAQGVPLLTAVAQRNQAKWQQFSGGAPLLPARAAAVAAWIERTVGARAHTRI
jgi:nucleoside-triphosphatase THEP1